jgi:hypothetical protein
MVNKGMICLNVHLHAQDGATMTSLKIANLLTGKGGLISDFITTYYLPLYVHKTNWQYCFLDSNNDNSL